MRFMMIVKASKESEACKMPSEELPTEMGKYNEELRRRAFSWTSRGSIPLRKGHASGFLTANAPLSTGLLLKPKS
jgi:hypothetical protein